MRASLKTILFPLFFCVPSLCSAIGASIERAPPAGGTASDFGLRIEDSWPNSCAPELDRVELRGQDLWVIAREVSDTRFCSLLTTRYVIDTRSRADARLALDSPGLYRVHYSVESRSGSALRGFQLMPFGDSLAAAHFPESGYWWADPAGDLSFAGPGIGMNIESQGGILSAVLFGYDGDGRPEWTLGTGALGEFSSELGLSRLSRGSGPRAAYRRPQDVEAIGALLIEPLGPARVAVWIAYIDPETADLSLRSVQMVRFSFGKTPADSWLGEWLLVLPGDDPSKPISVQFVLDQLRPSPDGFLLADAPGTVELLCVQEAQGRERLPELCRLTLIKEGVEFDFDQLGMRRLQGVDGEGRRVRLISLDAG